MRNGDIRIASGGASLGGSLEPAGVGGPLVLFAHGSGSSRHSPRNRRVAQALRDAGIGTLLFDLLTPDEEAQDRYTGHLRFDVELLAGRLIDATHWVRKLEEPPSAIGYFGASTGAAAALIAAAALGNGVGAVVSRGGRPDLALDAIGRVTARTLLIVGSLDTPVVALNEMASQKMTCERRMVLVPGAGHLFEEHGALDQVASLAAGWFARHLCAHAPARPARPQGERRP